MPTQSRGHGTRWCRDGLGVKRDIMTSRGQLWFIIVAVAVVAAGGAAAWWHWRPKPIAVAAVSLEPVDNGDAAPANPGYLGPQACAECHAQRVAEFLKTRH